MRQAVVRRLIGIIRSENAFVIFAERENAIFVGSKLDGFALAVSSQSIKIGQSVIIIPDLRDKGIVGIFAEAGRAVV